MPVSETPIPARLEIIMIRPCFTFFICGTTARAMLNAPSTLTAWIIRQSESETFSIGVFDLDLTPPAEWTVISIAPLEDLFCISSTSL